MRDFLRAFATVLCVYILLAICWIALLFFPIVSVYRYVPEPVYSDDGSMVIIPTINFNKDDVWGYLCIELKIQDTWSGKTLYQVQTRASGRMNWSVYWIGKNTFRLDSSDIGSYCWSGKNDRWGEIGCPSP